jgi:hypothetical protein
MMNLIFVIVVLTDTTKKCNDSLLCIFKLSKFWSLPLITRKFVDVDFNTMDEITRSLSRKVPSIPNELETDEMRRSYILR